MEPTNIVKRFNETASLVNGPQARMELICRGEHLSILTGERYARQSRRLARRYWAAVTEEELQQQIVGGVLDRLIAQFPRAVATYFAQQDSKESQPIQGETLADMASRIEAMENNPSGDNHGH